MTLMRRSPIRAGIHAAFRHRRLAYTLWFSLVVSALPALLVLGPLAAPFDEGPFRESIVKGWDSWAMMSWLSFKAREQAFVTPAIFFTAALGFFLQLFLSGGVIRTLLADVKRPVLRRVVSESAALFRPTLWAFARYAVTLLFWEGLLVGGMNGLLSKLAGEDARPNNGFLAFGEVWAVVVGLVVFLRVTARFDLARIALAKDDSPTARGAYRVAKQRLSGGPSGAVLTVLGWLIAGVALQALFTDLGIRMAPQTNGGVALLVVFRQLGFVALAMTRVGFWGALLAWEEARRPVAVPLPFWSSPSRPVPVPEPVPVSEPVVEPEAAPAIEPAADAAAG